MCIEHITMHTGKRKYHMETEETRPAKKERLDKRETGNKTTEKILQKKQTADKMVLKMIKKEPDPTEETKIGLDVKPTIWEIESDVKPTVGALHCKEESGNIISRVAKESGRLLFEEYPISTSQRKPTKTRSHTSTLLKQLKFTPSRPYKQ